jgi:hypothetical protein
MESSGWHLVAVNQWYRTYYNHKTEEVKHVRTYS